MITGSIARRYARALMGIGVDGKNYEALGRELGRLAEAMKISEELSATLSNPAFPRADRRKVLEAVMKRLGASPTIRNFTLLLLDRERLAIVPDVARELALMIDEKVGRVTAEVTSATPLAPGQADELRKKLEQLSGKSVQLSTEQDAELLGGVVAKVGDIIYDGSLRTQLRRMRQELLG
jgi:F-type H+-transporting ATPase subunit delta